jgi:hypothetical protein
MNKIIAGIVGLVLVTGVTAGAARAAFTSNATVRGISITAGVPGLQVGPNAQALSDDWNTNLNLNNVYPGFTNSTTIVLHNSSTTGVNFSVSGLLTAATGWPNLKDAVEVLVSNGVADTGWQTLSTWNAGPISIPLTGGMLTAGADQTLTVQVRVPTTVGNEISGQSLSNVTFTLTGTQL